jgi:hypothetical protein
MAHAAQSVVPRAETVKQAGSCESVAAQRREVLLADDLSELARKFGALSVLREER